MGSITLNSISSYIKVLESVSSFNSSLFSRVRENLDFSDFSNFVWFGSARFEVDNAVLDIQENYPNFDKWNISSGNLSLSAEDDLVSLYSSWKNKSDPFVDYFARDIAEYSVTATITGSTYAKGSDNSYVFIFPWFDYSNPFTSSQQQNITVWEEDADSYDSTNMNSIIKMVPDFVTEEDEDLKTLLQVIGHHFDDIFLASKRHLDIYNFSYKESEMPEDEVLNAFIDSLGMGRFYQFTEKNILDFYENIYSENCNYSKKKFSKLMKMIFINNVMQIIKSKGTKESIYYAENVFGWPKNLIDIEEYIHVSDNISPSGISFELPEIKLQTNIVSTENSPFCFTTGDISNNHSLTSTSFSSSPHGVIFSFSLSGIQDLKNKTNFWSGSQEKCLFEIQTTNADKSKRNYLCFIARSAASGFHLRNYTDPSYNVNSLSGVWNISFTDSQYSSVDDNTIFTIGFNLAKNSSALSSSRIVFGTQAPINSIQNIKNNPSSITSSNTGSYIYEVTPNSTTRYYTAYDTDFIEKITVSNQLIPGLIPLSLKIYDKPLWTTLVSSTMLESIKPHIGDYEYFKRTNSNILDSNNLPKKWYKFNNTSSTSVIDSTPNSNIWDRISLTSISGGTTQTLLVRPVTLIKNYTYYAGDSVDNIGIYPEIKEINSIRSSNKLKVYISPVKVINELIDKMISFNNIDMLYGKPEDLYRDRYSVLTDLQGSLYSFLSNFSTSRGINLSKFFEILERGYSENILDFIVENLIPAKCNAQTGIFIENDKIYDQKFKWTKPSSENVVLEDSTDKRFFGDAEKQDFEAEKKKDIWYSSEEKSLETEKIISISKESNDYDYGDLVIQQTEKETLSEDNYESSELIKINPTLSENNYESSELVKTPQALSFDEDSGSLTAQYFPQSYSLSCYEDNYWYHVPLWEERKDYQGNENNLVTITGCSFFGKSKWIDQSKSTISFSGYEKRLAHLENSKVVYSFSNDKLFSNETGHLHLDLLRYGFSSPGAYVKIKVPPKSYVDDLPVMTLSGLNSYDVYDLPLSSCKEYSLRLDENGRTVDCILNVDISSTSYAQSSTEITFSTSNGNVILPIQASSLNRGSAGNGMIVEIVLDEALQSDYAITQVDNDRTLTIKVVESPYICYGILSALTSNSKVSSLFSIDITNLETARDTLDDEGYRTSVFGKYYLEGGSDDSSNIKNKEYKIDISNVYNSNDIESFTIRPKVKTTIIDSNRDLDQQSNDW